MASRDRLKRGYEEAVWPPVQLRYKIHRRVGAGAEGAPMQRRLKGNGWENYPGKLSTAIHSGSDGAKVN
ncbi:hypothetical protein EFA69_03800 [Rufibacter immobilis]|uniref:Uncharacterized protein n=1 Tax=Rufibacter immobilis TaxID=1348778 RepID=A0A3M9N568_9BACT|nr:hypothetical protein EFA69_03800 [Rufibacter immobilis]